MINKIKLDKYLKTFKRKIATHIVCMRARVYIYVCMYIIKNVQCT